MTKEEAFAKFFGGDEKIRYLVKWGFDAGWEAGRRDQGAKEPPACKHEELFWHNLDASWHCRGCGKTFTELK